jgi:formylglycine-generating enzyme required for sulfatase activity
LRRAALLALGEFDRDGLPLPMRERLIPRLAQLYQDDGDPGVRAAARWLLGQWQKPSRLAEMDQALSTGRPLGNRRWYLNAQGQTFVLLAPGQFQRGKGEGQFRGRVEYPFALAWREVTLAEFLRFRENHRVARTFAPTDDCPVNSVSWYDAAAYCNWLSKQEDIPEDQWCYVRNAQGEYAEGMQAAPDLLRRSGYRLPTAAEWEYACRAGSVTRWSIGEAEDLLSKYAWCISNASSRSHPVGTLRPNDLGLFDMHGNMWEWCQDRADNRPADGRTNGGEIITDAGGRRVRGGAFGQGLLSLHSASEISMSAKVSSADIGFRPARTVLLPARAAPPFPAEPIRKK